MTAWTILFGAIALTTVAASADAQRCTCCGAGVSGDYRAAAETTLTGTVEAVKAMARVGRQMAGVHLVLSSPSGLVDVHIGPAWYVSSKHIEFAKGDVLTIVGWNSTIGDSSFVIAREVKTSDQILTLRDEKGLPLWSAPRRGR